MAVVPTPPTGLIVLVPAPPQPAINIVGADVSVNLKTNTIDVQVAATLDSVQGALSLTVLGPIPFVSAPGTLNEDTVVGPFVDKVNHRVGIGTNTPSGLLDVEGGDVKFSGQIKTLTGLFCSTVAAGLRFLKGANARVGTGSMVAGTAVVANTSVTANSIVMVQGNGGGSNAGYPQVTSQNPGVGFTITSTNSLDNNKFVYFIFEAT